jgi:hypothetical protein
MSGLKFFIMLSTGILLVGLMTTTAMSQSPPPDGPDGPGAKGPPPPRGPEADRPPPSLFGAPLYDTREEQRALQHSPMMDDLGFRRGPPFGSPPRGREGDRPQPPGPGYDAPRGREDPESLQRNDPELFKAIREDREMEHLTRALADQYRRAGKDEQAKIKENLTEMVIKHFEVRQQLRNLEVKRLEQQLKQLRDKIDQRVKNRKDIVQKRIIELTGPDEGDRF